MYRYASSDTSRPNLGISSACAVRDIASYIHNSLRCVDGLKLKPLVDPVVSLRHYTLIPVTWQITCQQITQSWLLDFPGLPEVARLASTRNVKLRSS